MQILLSRVTLRIGVATTVILGVACNSFAQEITTFDVPNSDLTYPTSVNSAGQITGYYSDENGQHAFLRYANGTFATFNVPGSNGTTPTYISLTGQVIGYSYGPPRQRPEDQWWWDSTRGFVRQPDGTIILFDACDAVPAVHGFPSASDTFPQTISPPGDITGLCSQGIWIDGYTYGFMRQADGTTVPLPNDNFFSITAHSTFLSPQAINPRGQMTGACSTAGPAGIHGFLLQPKSVSNAVHEYCMSTDTFVVFDAGPDLQWESATRPEAINPAGEITGSYWQNASGAYHGFLRQQDGTITIFDPEGSSITKPQAINPGGQITGFYQDASLVYHGFLRQQDGSIATFDVSNSTATYPTAISPAGHVVGWYADATGGVHGFLRSK